ncbi:hypothetical protein NDN08_006417 [Rhodosorus marinus]|uniref:Spindle and kinetochore-associated protein 3 n=1 Tax=Rhodosorus marinus TaxID=101924 RepID=A0AAV8UPI6_9RHOD|nr:hypothetical protein NDN08_006417 [Rhodosorus marinus]
MTENVVKEFIGELRRSLTSTAERSEALRMSVTTSSMNAIYNPKFALESAGEIGRRADRLQAEATRFAVFCSESPSMESLTKLILSALDEGDKLVSQMEIGFSEYGYVPPPYLETEKLPNTSDNELDDLLRVNKTSETTPEKESKGLIEVEEELNKTPSLADFGISRAEVENLVRATTQKTKAREQPDDSDSSQLLSDHGLSMPFDPELLPEFDKPEVVAEKELSRVVRTTLDFDDSEIDDIVPEERYKTMVSAFTRSRAPVEMIRSIVSRLRKKYGSDASEIFISQEELDKELSVASTSVKALSLALTQMKLVAIKRTPTECGYLWCGGFPVLA